VKYSEEPIPVEIVRYKRRFAYPVIKFVLGIAFSFGMSSGTVDKLLRSHGYRRELKVVGTHYFE
jgi:hypothetical protein